jgi:hypothetical protein
VLGVLAALVVLCARLLSISKWTVTAVREIARALERGDELPLVDGGPPSAADSAPD